MPSEVVLDAFQLTVEIRSADMRPSPYDVRALGLAPLPSRRPQGKAEYGSLQGDVAKCAAGLHSRIVARLNPQVC